MSFILLEQKLLKELVSQLTKTHSRSNCYIGGTFTYRLHLCTGCFGRDLERREFGTEKGGMIRQEKKTKNECRYCGTADPAQRAE